MRTTTACSSIMKLKLWQNHATRHTPEIWLSPPKEWLFEKINSKSTPIFGWFDGLAANRIWQMTVTGTELSQHAYWCTNFAHDQKSLFGLYGYLALFYNYKSKTPRNSTLLMSSATNSKSSELVLATTACDTMTYAWRMYSCTLAALKCTKHSFTDSVRRKKLSLSKLRRRRFYKKNTNQNMQIIQRSPVHCFSMHSHIQYDVATFTTATCLWVHDYFALWALKASLRITWTVFARSTHSLQAKCCTGFTNSLVQLSLWVVQNRIHTTE